MGGTFDSGLTQPERAASQRELDQLRARVEQMDMQGTRGVAVLVAQVSDLAKDIADDKSDTDKWRREHERQHEHDEQARVVGRRWIVGIGVAGLASMATVITMLQQVLVHVH